MGAGNIIYIVSCDYYVAPGGIEKNNFSSLVLLSPNPSIHVINIHLPLAFYQSEIILFDYTGKSIRMDNIIGNNHMLKKGSLTSGIYSIRIINSDGKFAQKNFVFQ